MRHRTVLLVTVLVLGAVGGPAAGLAAADDIALEIVVETPEGSAVDDAEVTVSWDGGSNTGNTSSNGRVFIDVPEGEDVSIDVNHATYVRNRPHEIDDVTAEEVTVTAWEKATASVTVVDADGPVEDVRVAFRKSGTFVGAHRTDGAGIVESGVIESGEYTLRLSKSGYFRESVTIDVQEETSEEVTIERGSVGVTFTVLDDHFDPPRPVSEATIEGAGFSTQTQPDGQRTVSVPVNSEQSITVQKEGYRTVDRTISIDEEAVTVNVTTRRTPVVNIEVTNQRVVVGESVLVTVTDEYGDPFPEATVYLDDSAVGQPDDTGTIRVPIESRGEFTLFAEAEDLSSAAVNVTGVVPGEDPTPTTSPPPTTADDGTTGDLFDINARSTAIGLAGGLVVAVALFLLLRFR